MEVSVKHIYNYLKNKRKPKLEMCEVCDEERDEVFICQICNSTMCHECSTPFTQHNNIDFDCCYKCSSRANDRDDD
jgi:hypothetical protein